VAKAGIRLNGEESQESEREDKTRMGHGCPETHANERREIWATVACFSAKQGLGIYNVESESVAIQCMLRREREMGGKGMRSRKGGSCQCQIAWCRPQKGSGIQIKRSE
jgi:hypothetical protein